MFHGPDPATPQILNPSRRSKMFRRTLWLALSLVVVLSLMLAACGPQPTEETPAPVPTEEPTPVETEPPEPEISLVIWADETRAPILQALAEDFQTSYGVGLDVQQVADINDQLPIAAPAGEGPDIFIGPHDRLGGWVDSGLVTPIDLGDRASELLEVGAALRASGDVTYALALEDNGYKIYPILTSFGGYVFGRSEDGTWNPSDLGIDSQGMIAAGDWIAENVAAGLISPNANDADTAQTLFETGEAAFLMTGPWAVARFQEAGFNYAISPFPSGGQPFLGVQGFMINAFSENILLAQAFLTEFVATEDVMRLLYEAGDRPSAFLSVLEVTDDPDLAAFGAAGENAALMPAIPEMGAVWGSWNSAVVLTITGGDTTENAFTVAGQQIRDVLGGATAGMVNVPGSYQAAAGCEGDWDPACEVTALA